MATAEFSKFVGVLSAALSQHHLSGLEYYSAIKRNASESVLMRWMNLEPIIQSEVSQKAHAAKEIKINTFFKEYILTSHPKSLFPSGLNSNNDVNFSHREEIISK